MSLTVQHWKIPISVLSRGPISPLILVVRSNREHVYDCSPPSTKHTVCLHIIDQSSIIRPVGVIVYWFVGSLNSTTGGLVVSNFHAQVPCRCTVIVRVVSFLFVHPPMVIGVLLMPTQILQALPHIVSENGDQIMHIHIAMESGTSDCEAALREKKKGS